MRGSEGLIEFLPAMLLNVDKRVLVYVLNHLEDDSGVII